MNYMKLYEEKITSGSRSSFSVPCSSSSSSSSSMLEVFSGFSAASAQNPPSLLSQRPLVQLLSLQIADGPLPSHTDSADSRASGAELTMDDRPPRLHQMYIASMFVYLLNYIQEEQQQIMKSQISEGL